MKYIYSTKNRKGVALIITILLMTLILFLAIYFLSFSLTEKQIAHNQALGAKTYYLAEAGFNEMVWKLKNDTVYKNNFETNSGWAEEFDRDNPFGAGSGSYTVAIANSGFANGEIVSEGAIDVGDGKVSRRIVRAKIYKALVGGLEGDVAAYGNHDININNSAVYFYGGDTFSNHDINIDGSSSDVFFEHDVMVGHSFDVDSQASTTVGGVIDVPTSIEIDIPAIDFYSSDPNSYKNRANVVYDDDDFEDLMWSNQTLTLNDDITYVDKDIELRGGQTLIINGILVVEHDFKVGENECWNDRCGYNTLTVNNTPGKPSGILVKHDIDFKEYTGDVNINGLIYASHDVVTNNVTTGYDFNIYGAAVGGHDAKIESTPRTVNIYYNTETIAGIFSSAEFSPIITFEHWEEEY
ncbi:MAG: pilus assembly PilX N-terminal domain-containing protein [Patescibacteria group bacterium]